MPSTTELETARPAIGRKNHGKNCLALLDPFISLIWDRFSGTGLRTGSTAEKDLLGRVDFVANLWIPWLAKDAKIFEKNGLDVEPVLLRGSGQTSQAMVSGSLFASSVALPAVMLADLNGADLVNVAHGIAAQGSKLMVRPEIRKLEDLKGKKIGISSLGSAGDLLFGYVLRKYGIDTNREVFWLAVGNTAERLQALVLWRSRCRGPYFSRGPAGRAEGISRLARCEKRDRLPDGIRSYAAQDDPGGSRYGDALCEILCGRHRLFETE